MPSGATFLRKILYVGMHYEYGRRHLGESFEYNNFYRTLIHMVPDVIEFDFMTLLQEHGREEMNRMLVEKAEAVNPDLIFIVLFTDEIDRVTIRGLSERYPTFNWFCDDHWRFGNFSRFYAPCFTCVSTTDPEAIGKYRRIGYRHVVLTQWACNHHEYRNLGLEKNLDVTFVGQPHGNRKAVIDLLRKNSIGVDTFGDGWPRGRIAFEEMVRIINASRINLNLSNSSWNIHTFFRRQQQIKGRNFEIPGCGGFLLTNYVRGLESFYRPDEEIVCFSSRRELVRKIRYYLTHAAERESIAARGYERTLREHTYDRRFTAIFENMGFAV